MLNTQDQQALVSHEVYGPLIRRVARQETFRSNAIYGFRIMDSDDLLQDLLIQLIKTDTGVAALGKLDSPEAWLRVTARFMSQAAVDKTLGSRKNDRGVRVGRVDVMDPADWTSDRNFWNCTALFATKPSEPEDVVVDEVNFDRMLNDTHKVIRGIIRKVENPLYREALVGYYLRGEKLKDSRDKKRSQRGHTSLNPEDIASLQAWRTYNFPDAKRPPASKADATALQAAAEKW